MKKTARLAGLIYLILILSGIFILLYVPDTLFVSEDVAATYKNIAENKLLFKLGVLAGFICYTCFIILPLVLYKLLSKVNRPHAILMVVFAVLSVPISYLNMENLLTALSLVEDSKFLGFFNEKELHGQLMMSLERYGSGNLVAHIFWGLWLFPFGCLVYKSGFLPKFLGICLMLGCFGYLLDFVGYFMCPGYSDTTIALIAGIPSSIGEIGICLWLLILGVRKQT